jgi:hypothetical protein
MNESEWNELQRLWKSSPPQPQPIVEELERLRRRRRWFAAEIVTGVVMSLAGLTAGIAMLVRGGTFLIVGGSATLLFVAVVCALSLWARFLPKARPEDAVGHALTIARRNALAGVRYAASMIWAGIVGIVFAAAMALARGLLTAEAQLGGYIAIGSVLLMLAAWLAFAFRYYQQRSTALARLDAIAEELAQ